LDRTTISRRNPKNPIAMETSTPASENLFALNSVARTTFKVLGGRVPVLLVDNVFNQPETMRARALELSYANPRTAYPGRIAQPDERDQSLNLFLRGVLELVNQHYLPRVPPILANGQPIRAFRTIHADFAITDFHPDELEPLQRKPHTDPVSLFGLVYLNREPRGGTLFFDRGKQGSAQQKPDGYCSAGDEEFSLIGRIDGLFNRLAIYPGFILHSGEIEGEWIKGDDRFRSPRLTLRLAFMP
jgi:Family of unknown function (DUF6445)